MGTADYELFLLVSKSKLASLRDGVVFTDTLSDSDWAKDKKHRISVTSSLTFVDMFVIEQTVTAQDVQALSSGEAEYYAVGSGCRDSLYVRALLKEMGFSVAGLPDLILPGRAFSDSSNAITNGQRLGPSRRTRHIYLRSHFLQKL